MDRCCCSTCNDERMECPICHAQGQAVSMITVRSLVNDVANEKQTDHDFYICLSPNCNVVYFGHGISYYQEDVLVPVAFKEGASPQFVCYCNRVTEEEIADVVINGGARTVGDVARLTGAMRNGKCLTTNPKGVCCHKDIETVIDRVINKDK